MFLIEISPDELSYLKETLDHATVSGSNVIKHAEIRKRCDQPIVGEKLVQDIQQKALQESAPAATAAPAPVRPQVPPMPQQDALQAYPLPNGPTNLPPM